MEKVLDEEKHVHGIFPKVCISIYAGSIPQARGLAWSGKRWSTIISHRQQGMCMYVLWKYNKVYMQYYAVYLFIL